MDPAQNPMSVVSSGLVVIKQPQCIITRYQPVAARIIGGGTSSVLASGAGVEAVPDGAVLISNFESGTSTSVF